MTGLLDLAERVACYVAALFLLATIGVLFFSAATDFLGVAGLGPLGAALQIPDEVLLVFIFAESLGTITTIVREREVRAAPSLLVGLIAIVRRIPAVTARSSRASGRRGSGTR